MIRNALWGIPCDFTEKPQWDKVLHLAGQQTVTGLVAQAITGLPDELHPDAELKLRLQSRVTSIYRSHSLLNRKIAQVKDLMDRNLIPTVLFKGQGVALNYPEPLSRQCGDIDLYVGERNFLKAMDLIEPGVVHDVNDYKDLKHFSVDSDGVHVELHRIAEILPGRRADREFQEWTSVELLGPDVRTVSIGGCDVNLPPVDFDVLYIMNHAWHHFINGGIGLRQLCDWSLYLHRFHDQVDVEKLAANLKRFGLTRAWQITSCVCVRYLGLPADECPLYAGIHMREADRVVELIFAEGNFGKYSSARKSRRPEGHFAGKWHSFMLSNRRTLRILKVSPKEVMRSWLWYFIRGMKNVNNRVQ